MKMKSTMNKYCPRCRKHTEHQVSLAKAGKRRSRAEGERRMARKTRGYGSFPKPIQKKFSKTTKKSVPLYRCTECDHKFHGKGLRLKKLEISKT